LVDRRRTQRSTGDGGRLSGYRKRVELGGLVDNPCDAGVYGFPAVPAADTRVVSRRQGIARVRRRPRRDDHIGGYLRLSLLASQKENVCLFSFNKRWWPAFSESSMALWEGRGSIADINIKKDNMGGLTSRSKNGFVGWGSESQISRQNSQMTI